MVHEVARLPADVDDNAADDDEEPLPGVPERRMSAGLSRKRLALIEEMVFGGLSRKEAAAKVGLTDRGSRYALGAPVVMSHYRKQLEILRQSEKPKSVHRLAELRDQDRSLKVALDASKALNEEHGGAHINIGVNVNIQPGYIQGLGEHSTAARRILEHAGSVRNAMDDREVER